MQRLQGPSAKQLWKNQRLIDQNGLIVTEQRQRLFDNFESATLFENLLKIYQLNGLNLHYIFLGMEQNEEGLKYFQTIKYKAYVRFRCTKKQFDGGRKMIGYCLVQYYIKRLDPSKIKCKHPYLLVFRPAAAQTQCNQCGQTHFSKIFQSSLYVIRSQFLSMIQHKLFFMDRYPLYNFTPFDYTEKKNYGDVIYEFIKDHNYQPSYYVQKSQEVVCNTIRMHALSKGMDFQAIRLDQYKTLFGEKHIDKFEQYSVKDKYIFKLKYICRKCDPKQIWTTKDTCVGRIAVMKMKKLPSSQGKQIYDSSQIKQKIQESLTQQNSKFYNIIDQVFNLKYNTKIQRRLDRSLKRQTQQYEQLQKKLNLISRWHQTIQEYKYPVLVVVQLDIPKMKCQVCKREKEGLIYITNLLDQLHSYTKHRTIERVQKFLQTYKEQ